jgi:HEPN domain-containing protein
LVDIGKHVARWREGAEEDIAAARDMVERGHIRHGLFFAHLAAEKALKARVVLARNETPPKIHNLLRLAELANLTVSPEQSDLFSEVNEFQLEGRYPESFPPIPTSEVALDYVRRIEKELSWLMAKS